MIVVFEIIWNFCVLDFFICTEYVVSQRRAEFVIFQELHYFLGIILVWWCVFFKFFWLIEVFS